MSSNNKKARIHVEKPELPQFLQRMKEQIVANEDIERKERSEISRRSRPNHPNDPDDDPTIVKLGADDLTEDEYKRMKTELESQYKLLEDTRHSKKYVNQELDIDLLISSRQNEPTSSTNCGNKSIKPTSELSNKSRVTDRGKITQRNISYGSSSDEED